MGMNKKNSKQVWKYTDDIVAIIVVIAWFIAWGMGTKLPEWLLTAVLGYVFGKNIPIQH